MGDRFVRRSCESESRLLEILKDIFNLKKIKNMKVKISILFLFLGGFIIQSCEQMELQDYFIEPSADIQLSENKIFVFEPLTITNN